MPIADHGRSTFFDDPRLDCELPTVNEVFWAALLGHIEHDRNSSPSVVLDVGCHTGGLLQVLAHQFAPTEIIGIEPLAEARSAAVRRLRGVASNVSLLDVSEWDRVPEGRVDLIVSHEVLYLEADVPGFMRKIRRALAPNGVAYVILGCHAENPMWQIWKRQVSAAGHQVYDHVPIRVMEDASSADLLPAVQPLRRSGWVTYDPPRADYHYPSVAAMFEHHYQHKLIFRLIPKNDARSAP